MNAVLVLNQDYSPLTVCSVERAFLLLYLNKAELIQEVENRKLRSVSSEYPYPSVVKIFRYINIGFQGVVLTRHNIFKRDNYECQYCGTSRDLTLDHLIPRSKGGRSIWTNLVTACKSCNSKKGGDSPDSVGMVLSKKPTRPTYAHFLMKSNRQVREDWLKFLDPKAHAS